MIVHIYLFIKYKSAFGNAYNYRTEGIIIESVESCEPRFLSKYRGSVSHFCMFENLGHTAHTYNLHVFHVCNFNLSLNAFFIHRYARMFVEGFELLKSFVG